MSDLLTVRGLAKSFAGVEVLHGVDLELQSGIVHALVGENGAGKSTLIKILSGVHRRDAGQIVLDGAALGSLTPGSAHAHGIVTIYQERNLIPFLSVAENILLGDMPTGILGIVRWSEMVRRAQEILDGLRLGLDARAPVAELSAAEQQAVEIAKALYKRARIVIMDEPTASLNESEIENLFRLVRQLKQEGAAVIYISHRLDEIFAIADEVTVLRDGHLVLQQPIAGLTHEDLVKAMVGGELKMTRIGTAPHGIPVLEIERASRAGAFEEVTLSLGRGEAVGIAGTVGSGRSELLRALAGVDPLDTGTLRYDGQELRGLGLDDFIGRGICFVPAERDAQGLIACMSVAGNVSLANLSAVTRGEFLDLRRERALAQDQVKALDIQLKGVGQEVQYLSGGNRQKVMLAKWLSLGPDVFLLDEPSQGVDVGAREEIHRIMKGLLDQGKGILMVTSDLDELMNMSHRIAVMREGRLVALLDAHETTREEVLSYAIGRTSAEPGNAAG
jgi:ABC-type sugar transport system ATPase subunit